jgi:hypothetical protein
MVRGFSRFPNEECCTPPKNPSTTFAKKAKKGRGGKGKFRPSLRPIRKLGLLLVPRPTKFRQHPFWALR